MYKYCTFLQTSELFNHVRDAITGHLRHLQPCLTIKKHDRILTKNSNTDSVVK